MRTIPHIHKTKIQYVLEVFGHYKLYQKGDCLWITKNLQKK